MSNDPSAAWDQDEVLLPRQKESRASARRALQEYQDQDETLSPDQIENRARAHQALQDQNEEESWAIVYWAREEPLDQSEVLSYLRNVVQSPATCWATLDLLQDHDQDFHELVRAEEARRSARWRRWNDGGKERGEESPREEERRMERESGEEFHDHLLDKDAVWKGRWKYRVLEVVRRRRDARDARFETICGKEILGWEMNSWNLEILHYLSRRYTYCSVLQSNASVESSLGKEKHENAATKLLASSINYLEGWQVKFEVAFKMNQSRKRVEVLD